MSGRLPDAERITTTPVRRLAVQSSRAKRRRLIGALAFLALTLVVLTMAGADPFSSVNREPEIPAVRLANVTILGRFPSVVAPGQPAFLAVEPSGNVAISDRVRQLVLRPG